MLMRTLLLMAAVGSAAPDSLRPTGNAPANPAPPVASGRDSAAVADSLPWTLRDRGTVCPHGDAGGQVLDPAGLAVDSFGRIYVSDLQLHRMQQLDERGAFRWEAGVLGSDPGQMRRPTSVALLGTLSVAILDVENRRVSTFDLFGHHTGTLIDLARLERLDPVGRIDPIAMAADRGGALYLADSERDRVIAFDFAGNPIAVIGGFGTRPGSFRGLRGLAVTPRSVLVTAERTNARVQRLDAGGRVIGWWPIPVAPGRGRLPVAATDSGRVVVADETSGKLWVYDGDGRLLAARADLDRPSAVGFARDGSLLVAESRAGRVRRFVLEGRPLGAER